MLSTLLDFFFPPRCPNCSSYVEQRGGFCPACAQRLIGLRSIARTPEAAECLAGIWALGHYREGVRDLLRALKYQKRRSVLPDFETLLEEGETVLAQLPRPLTAVAVPLSRERAQERGFNQTEEIFASWLGKHSIELVPALVRTRATAPLYDHTRTERRRELRGAFAPAENLDVTGLDILLVDDIMTTGATLIECARTLKRAGAHRIYALVLTSEHI